MTEYTRPATWEDVLVVAQLFEAHAVDYVLIGGYALAAHGYVRFSEDVDVLVSPTRDNARRWIAALSELPDGAAKELEGEDAIFEGSGAGAIRINDEFTVDVLPSACGHEWDELAPHAVEVSFGAQRVRVLGLEGLLLTKEADRDKDRMDAKVIRAALEERQRRSHE